MSYLLDTNMTVTFRTGKTKSVDPRGRVGIQRAPFTHLPFFAGPAGP